MVLLKVILDSEWARDTNNTASESTTGVSGSLGELVATLTKVVNSCMDDERSA